MLQINDLVLMPGIFGYIDDSTVVESYVPEARANSEEIRGKQESMATRAEAVPESCLRLHKTRTGSGLVPPKYRRGFFLQNEVPFISLRLSEIYPC